MKFLLQHVEEDVHLRRTGREDPMEASMHIGLALETSFPRLFILSIRIRSRANLCINMYSILGYRDYGNRLTINST